MKLVFSTIQPQPIPKKVVPSSPSIEKKTATFIQTTFILRQNLLSRLPDSSNCSNCDK
jgi:hypothetical protein